MTSKHLELKLTDEEMLNAAKSPHHFKMQNAIADAAAEKAVYGLMKGLDAVLAEYIREVPFTPRFYYLMNQFCGRIEAAGIPAPEENGAFHEPT